MSWPLSQDYNEAVQNAATCFSDPDLRGGDVTAGALGLPIPRSGNFADVYQVRGPDGRRWAVKCFTRRVADLQERYSRIDAHLRKADLPFTVGFSYLPEGVRVRGSWYPVLKMEWVDGFTLTEFVREHLTKTPQLEALLRIWVRLTRRLREARITHADLQHGNVLLVPGSSTSKLGLKLIDYDGMWIPALSGQPSGEVGHPAYQHPIRVRDKLYTAEADRFPQLVVASALRGLMIGGAELWKRFDNGDNMLFREEDLKNPGASLLMKVLWGQNDPVLRGLLAHLILSINRPLVETPWLDHLLADGHALELSAEQEAMAAATLGVAPRALSRPTAQRAPVFSDPFKEGDEDDDSSASPDNGHGEHRRVRSKLMPIAIAGVIASVLIGICIAIVAGIGKSEPTQPIVNRPVSGEVIERDPPEKKEEQPPPRRGPVRRAPVANIGPVGRAGLIRTYQAESDSIAAVAFLPSGRQAVEIDGAIARIWGLASAKPEVVFKHPATIRGLAVSRDGKFVVTAADDRAVRILSVEKGEATQQFRDLDSAAVCCAVSPDAQRALGVTESGAIHEWDMASGEEKNKFVGTEPGSRAAAYSVDGSLVVLALKNGAQVWDLEFHQIVRTFGGHEGPVNAIGFAPDGLHVYSASDDKSVRLWSIETGQEVRLFAGHTERVLSLALSNDGSLVAAGAADGTVLVWDTATGKVLRQVVAPKADSEARALAFSAEGRRLLVGQPKGRMQLYRLPRFLSGAPSPDESQPVLLWQFAGGAAPACLQFMPEANRFVSSPGTPSELRWQRLDALERPAKNPADLTALELLAPPIGVVVTTESKANERGQVLSLNVTPTGDIISGAMGLPVAVWDSKSFALKRRFEVIPGYPGSLALAPDGKTALLASENGVVRLLSVESGKQLAVARLHEAQRVLSAHFSADGEEIVSLDEGGTIVVWTPNQEEISRFTDTLRAGRQAVLSPDRELVMAYGGSDSIALYDAVSGKEMHVLRGHTHLALDAAFTPDGRQIVSVGVDRTLRIWDAKTGKQTHEAALPAIGTNVRIAPDGDYALTSTGSGQSGSVQLWKLPAAESKQ